ncbi:hypothetical protein MKEN_01105300 [Mycena kentingensis (nom. inval.)]|nr:hypothetical protein MKEN_01105300 [Mycena kentingensis (nom. inval.)]
MGLLSTASAVSRKSGPEVIYLAHLDEDWAISLVPHGGYVLSVVTEACIAHQASSELTSPIHVGAHYINQMVVGAAEIRLRVVKEGKNFVNIVADLEQEGTLRFTAHFIFSRSILSTYPLKAPAPGSQFGRLIPFQTPPQTLLPKRPWDDNLPWFPYIRWAVDPSFSMAGTNGLTHWGAWVELNDPVSQNTLSSLGVFADCIFNLGFLWPKEVTGGASWQPTLTLDLEWKHPIPAPSAAHAPRTVGVYVVSGYLGAPQSRHSTFVEIWSAPAGIAEKKKLLRDGWREEQVLLAVSAQMQLISNGDANFGQRSRASSKL